MNPSVPILSYNNLKYIYFTSRDKEDFGTLVVGWLGGCGIGYRTRDLHIFSLTLSQLSYVKSEKILRESFCATTQPRNHKKKPRDSGTLGLGDWGIGVGTVWTISGTNGDSGIGGLGDWGKASTTIPSNRPTVLHDPLQHRTDEHPRVHAYQTRFMSDDALQVPQRAGFSEEFMARNQALRDERLVYEQSLNELFVRGLPTASLADYAYPVQLTIIKAYVKEHRDVARGYVESSRV